MTVCLDYKLVGLGWAACSLTVGDKHIDLTASYIGDALGDLVTATLFVMQGESEAQFSFQEEPGRYQWTLRRIADDRIAISIAELERNVPAGPNEEGVEVFQATCDRLAFARAMVTALDEVLREHGPEGYREKWVEYDFPLAEYRELKELV